RLVSDWSSDVCSSDLTLALAAFHRDAPPVRYQPWLLALPVAIAVEAGLLFFTIPPDPWTFSLLDAPGMYCLALVGAAVVHLLRRGRGTPSWSLALTLLALTVLGLRVVTLIDDS